MALDFMYARAGYGIGLDLSFPIHVRNAKEGGVPLRGAYWAMRPSRPVRQQVDLLDKAMDDAGGDLFPVLDVEILDGLTPREVADASLEFCERIESRRGLRCVVYSYVAFLKAIPFDASFTARALSQGPRCGSARGCLRTPAWPSSARETGRRRQTRGASLWSRRSSSPLAAWP
jgi:hypothetical protein